MGTRRRAGARRPGAAPSVAGGASTALQLGAASGSEHRRPRSPAARAASQRPGVERRDQPAQARHDRQLQARARALPFTATGGDVLEHCPSAMPAPANDGPPAWAQRLKRQQSIHHGVATAAHADPLRGSWRRGHVGQPFGEALSLFKRRDSVRYSRRRPSRSRPIRRAAQAWDERIGSVRVQARNWRIMALGCLAADRRAPAPRSSGSPPGARWCPTWSRSTGSARRSAVAPATVVDYRPDRSRRSLSTWRASSRMSAKSPPTRSCSGRTGSAPTTSPPIAARSRSTTTPARPTPSPASAKSRWRSRSPASSGRPQNSFQRRVDRAPLRERPARPATERWTAILTIVDPAAARPPSG